MHSINIHWIEKQGLRTWSWQGTHSPSHSVGMRTQAPGLQASTEWASSSLLKEREASPWIRFKIPKFVLFYTAQIYWAKDITWGGARQDGLAENTIQDHFWSSIFTFLFFKSKELAQHSSGNLHIHRSLCDRVLPQKASWVLGAGVQTMGRWLPHPQSSSSLCQHPTSHTPTGLLKSQNSHRATQAAPRGGLWGQSLTIRSAFCKLRESHFTFPYLGFPTYNDKSQLVWLM